MAILAVPVALAMVTVEGEATHRTVEQSIYSITITETKHGTDVTLPYCYTHGSMGEHIIIAVWKIFRSSAHRPVHTVTGLLYLVCIHYDTVFK